ncbi:MAG: 50S ribosomal protein L20 [Patescibacteria group bacterium]|nr:50S ribosomal protein L20 [Patescibacteria group bacterium]
MPRVKRGTHHIKRRKNILARTKGMMWGRKSKLTQAKIASTKAGLHAFTDRKIKKRVNRGLQNIRINAAARLHGTTYSQLISQIKKKNINLNRLVLSQIADKYPAVFEKIVKA